MVSEVKLGEKWSLKRLSSHSSWGCWLDQYRERLDKEAGNLKLCKVAKGVYFLGAYHQLGRPRLWKRDAAIGLSRFYNLRHPAIITDGLGPGCLFVSYLSSYTSFVT